MSAPVVSCAYYRVNRRRRRRYLPANPGAGHGRHGHHGRRANRRLLGGGSRLILAGEGGVDFPGVSILRCTAGVDPDPRVHVLIVSRYDPPFVTEASATDDVARGRRVVGEALGADERLRTAFAEFGVVYELVSSSGERGTTVLLATVDADGSLGWVDGLRPGG